MSTSSRIMSNLSFAELPPQFSTGDRCNECRKPLSCYNPYEVCGPCRYRISLRLALSVLDLAADGDEGADFSWEKFPRRAVVRRGPLLAETPLGGIEPMPVSLSE